MNGLWQRLRSGLQKTRAALSGALEALGGREAPSAQAFAALEEALVAVDVGPASAARIVQALQARGVRGLPEGGLRQLLAEELARELSVGDGALALDDPRRPPPRTALLVGVNGSGKTTTAGKLACRLRSQGQRVMLVAADTFRAAAGEQLELWGRRCGAQLVVGSPGQDPAAVAFDGIQAAVARGYDAVLVDTAGRLHNKAHLMAELAKIRRVVEKALTRPPDEVLLVLDATTGQNGLAQARIFAQAVQVSGLVITKLDGTARGGVAVAIAREFRIPIKLVGIGEGPDDLRPFEPRAFAGALLDVPL